MTEAKATVTYLSAPTQIGNILVELVAAAFALATVCPIFHFVAQRYVNSTVRRLGYLAIFGHTAAGFLAIHVLPYSWDIGKFDQAARTLLSGEPLSASTTVSAFASIQAVLYAVFGANPIAVSVFNGLLAVLTVLLVVKLARDLYLDFDRSTATASVSLFTPVPFFLLSVPMRDALATFSLLLILALAAAGLAENVYWLLLPVVPLFGGLYLLRPELGLLAILGILAAAGVTVLNRIARRRVTFSLIFAIGTTIGLLGFGLFFSRFPVSQLSRIIDYRATGGAGYLESMDYAGVLDVLLAAPARALYFQFTPFPLHVTSAFDFLAALTVPLLIFLVVGGYWSVSQREVDPVVFTLLLIVYIGGIVGYGLIDSNFGTVVRHRMPFEFILIAFAAPTLESLGRSLHSLMENPDSQTGGDDG